jgi:hypothetical protein
MDICLVAIESQAQATIVEFLLAGGAVFVFALLTISLGASELFCFVYCMQLLFF